MALKPPLPSQNDFVAQLELLPENIQALRDRDALKFHITSRTEDLAYETQVRFDVPISTILEAQNTPENLNRITKEFREYYVLTEDESGSYSLKPLQELLLSLDTNGQRAF